MSNAPLPLSATSKFGPGVLSAIQDFLDMANSHPRTPQGYRFSMDRPGRKFTRIIDTTATGSKSVHAFVDNQTGDLLKPATWAAPAKDARGNIVTDFMAVADNFHWAGGYLYKDAKWHGDRG